MAARIRTVNLDQFAECLTGLATLLTDAVNTGASLGFWMPMSQADAVLYWREVLQDMVHERLVLIVAEDGGHVVFEGLVVEADDRVAVVADEAAGKSEDLAVAERGALGADRDDADMLGRAVLAHRRLLGPCRRAQAYTRSRSGCKARTEPRPWMTRSTCSDCQPDSTWIRPKCAGRGWSGRPRRTRTGRPRSRNRRRLRRG